MRNWTFRLVWWQCLLGTSRTWSRRIVLTWENLKDTVCYGKQFLTDEMALQVRPLHLQHKPNHVRTISGTHVKMERGNWPQSHPLTSTYAQIVSACTHIHTDYAWVHNTHHAYTQNNKIKTRENSPRAGTMAQHVRVLPVLLEDQFDSQHPHGVVHNLL